MSDILAQLHYFVFHCTIEFLLPVTIVIILDVLVKNLITKLSDISDHAEVLMKFSIIGTPNSHGTTQFDVTCSTLKWMLESTMKWLLESTLIKVENSNQS